ncbi:hypothetical protein NY2A_b282L [Paramecium bursaria Chlorella virus NY2A]|uniref:Uncharacterized protein b282L n=1 Tax=Paramecium bursaria Chlorella virus NY2A TaxID=46021 RepID=A7IWF7_PBCVN|nr:hypothetical protein NY2A_b282L [Paramecium bursaria Chlorella virus NY2A]ABT14681.1 hypothetical protein NY2A_b282L [Paramecium bursaria Chlorella virus NY2A]
MAAFSAFTRAFSTSRAASRSSFSAARMAAFSSRMRCFSSSFCLFASSRASSLAIFLASFCASDILRTIFVFIICLCDLCS